MATLGFIEYADAPPAVKAVYDDIMATRDTDYINNFWKALAHDPATLRRTWESVKQIMAPGRDRSAHQGDGLPGGFGQQSVRLLHRIAHGRGPQGGMSDAQFAELMAVVGMANETNRLVSGYQVEIDERFRA